MLHFLWHHARGKQRTSQRKAACDQRRGRRPRAGHSPAGRRSCRVFHCAAFCSSLDDRTRVQMSTLPRVSACIRSATSRLGVFCPVTISLRKLGEIFKAAASCRCVVPEDSRYCANVFMPHCSHMAIAIATTKCRFSLARCEFIC